MTRWHPPEVRARLEAERRRAARRHAEQARAIDKAIAARLRRAEQGQLQAVRA